MSLQACIGLSTRTLDCLGTRVFGLLDTGLLRNGHLLPVMQQIARIADQRLSTMQPL